MADPHWQRKSSVKALPTDANTLLIRQHHPQKLESLPPGTYLTYVVLYMGYTLISDETNYRSP